MEIDLEGIKILISLMNEHSLSEVEVEQKGLKVRLKKAEANPRPDIITIPTHISHLPAVGVGAPALSEQGAAKATGEESQYLKVVSPMVGTFYRCPSPDADPYVEVGDTVDEDTVVCIIEAMKVMNEIKAECSGRVVEIVIGGGQPIEYGELLFLIDPRVA